MLRAASLSSTTVHPGPLRAAFSPTGCRSSSCTRWRTPGTDELGALLAGRPMCPPDAPFANQPGCCSDRAAQRAGYEAEAADAMHSTAQRAAKLLGHKRVLVVGDSVGAAVGGQSAEPGLLSNMPLACVTPERSQHRCWLNAVAPLNM